MSGIYSLVKQFNNSGIKSSKCNPFIVDSSAKDNSVLKFAIASNF